MRTHYNKSRRHLLLLIKSMSAAPLPNETRD
jgi:hypothetical protein